jgi:hypothetical protein
MEQGEGHLVDKWHRDHLEAIAKARRKEMQKVFIVAFFFGFLGCYIAMQEYTIHQVMERLEMYLGPKRMDREQP